MQSSDAYKSGEADMEDLCAQLKSKAKCSGKGAVIAENDADDILGQKIRKQNEDLFGGFGK